MVTCAPEIAHAMCMQPSLVSGVVVSGAVLFSGTALMSSTAGCAMPVYGRKKIIARWNSSLDGVRFTDAIPV